MRKIMPAKIAILGLAALLPAALPELAAQSFEAQRSFGAPVDRVYAAEQQAAGDMLKRTVERACLVQFQSNEAVTTFYRVMNWTATCRDAGNGSTTVTLAVQVQSTIVWGNEEAKQKVASQYWSDMDKALATGSAPARASPPPGGAPPPPATSPSAATNATGLAHITSEPAGAEIEVDGEYAGNTPATSSSSPARIR